MNDWGLTTALANMYGGPSQAQQRNSEFAQLEQMSKFYEKQNLEQEASAAKMQAYDAQVDKFADNLLASDRKRLYEKSRVLKASVREMIKANGGNMKDFFANGGHNVMAEYKSSLINSAESSDYLENKQNIGFVLKAMNEGKGHLISPKDKENFDRYMAEGKGKISYGGLKGEIKMPDPSRFPAGVTIKADDILNENYMVIASNYAHDFKGTSLDPTNNNVAPTREQLLAYTASQYGSMVGSGDSYFKKNQELRAQNQELRAQQSQQYSIQNQEISNQNAVVTMDRNKVGLQNDTLVVQKTMLEIERTQNEVSNIAQKINEGTVTKEDEDSLELQYGKEDYANVFDDIYVNFMDYDATPNNVDASMTKLINSNQYFKGILGPKYTASNRQLNYSGTQLLDIHGASPGSFTPASAYNLFKDDGERNIYKQYVAGKLGTTYDSKTNTIKDWKPSKGKVNVYHADGTSLQGTHGSMFGDSDYSDDYKGDYKVSNIITAATVDTPSGKQIVMRKGNEKVDLSVYQPDGKPNKAKMSTFAVIEKKSHIVDGDKAIFYVEVNPENKVERQNLAKVFDVTGATKNANRAVARKNANKEMEDAVTDMVKKDLYKLRTNRQWQSTAQQISGSGNYGDTALLNSFLLTTKNFRKSQINTVTGQPYTYDDIANMDSQNFFAIINEVNKNLPIETGGDILSKIRPSSNGRAAMGMDRFFQLLEKSQSSPSNKQLVQNWYNSYRNLKNN